MRGSAPEGWNVQLLQGGEAQDAIRGLLDRMTAHPERFAFDIDFED